jgi:hypothetical protein
LSSTEFLDRTYQLVDLIEGVVRVGGDPDADPFGDKDVAVEIGDGHTQMGRADVHREERAMVLVEGEQRRPSAAGY